MIYDFLSQVKNAALAKNDFLEAPYSTFAENIAVILKKAGFIKDFKVFKESGSYKGLRVDLSFDKDGEPAIKDIKIKSKPGLRVYFKAKKIFPVKGGRGLVIVSTSQGVMDGRDARKKSLGGEIVCQVL